MMLLFRILIGLLLILGPALHILVAATQSHGVQPFSRTVDHGGVAFNNTCTVGSFHFDADNATLGVYCNTDDIKDYAYDWTFIDLDLCIANYDGSLVPSPG